MLGVLAWVAIFGLAIFAPWIAETESHWVKTKTGLLLGWIATTIFGLLSGKSSHTSGGAGAQVAGSSAKNSSSMEVIAAIAPYIFIIGTLFLLSLGVHALVIWQIAPTVVGYWSKVSAIPPLWPVVAMVVLGSVAAILACRVDVNIFSMNLLYRNRLIRCYLGASRNVGERQPNRFTGFDPADDLLLTEFDGSTARTEHPELPAYKGPYPIICAALNVTHGERLAWQERKAESFAFTPRFCGYEYPEMKYEPNPAPEGTYRTTDKYAYPQNSRSALHLKAGGVHLGTAVSISGAAASPNMGFHTSPPLAFLMTLFDVRLGWWLPNPRYDNDQLSGNRTEGGPQWSLLYLLKELLASTTDESKYVYLSDGGHFENFAVYELVRRRCKYIIASDADADCRHDIRRLGQRHSEMSQRLWSRDHDRSDANTIALGSDLPGRTASLEKFVIPIPRRKMDSLARSSTLSPPCPLIRLETFSHTAPVTLNFPINPPRINGSTNRSSRAIAGWVSTRCRSLPACPAILLRILLFLFRSFFGECKP